MYSGERFVVLCSGSVQVENGTPVELIVEEAGVSANVDGQRIGWLPDKGFYCVQCFAPVLKKDLDHACECGCDRFDVGGPATRLSKSGFLNGKYACYVSDNSDKELIRIEFYIVE